MYQSCRISAAVAAAPFREQKKHSDNDYYDPYPSSASSEQEAPLVITHKYHSLSSTNTASSMLCPGLFGIAACISRAPEKQQEHKDEKQNRRVAVTAVTIKKSHNTYSSNDNIET